ncbi:E3 ubiquitin-protein ligase UPL4 [Dichanthelium oligosanthes]|uniref:HECT-type E3 ubiquitin transferase n=1 Tax=Dichanthelium oligosanthes TaxID=888268 RepID=A0A1E5UXM8_9POAL|nr:E3 ubiquitin-protein ligase UPL4 [Dichanthelium oligosanthes]
MEVAQETGEAVLAYALAAIANKGAGPGEAAAALAALCDVLSLSGPDLIVAIPSARLASHLPRLLAASAAGAGDDGDVPLLAARAMAEACEGAPEWAARFAQHGAVEALRDRLLAVDGIELAEECLRALDTISLECPDECLSRGVAAAVLQFFDFFSTNKQKVALRIVSNIFSNYDEEDTPTAMEAVPALCNLLQSSDKTILESAISCLALVAAGASENSEHMGMLCERNAVEATMSLMGNEGWKSLSDDTLTGILGLLKNLASVSAKAVKSLFELDFCELLKQMITYYSSSHHDNDKVQMLLELIYQLLLRLEASEQHAKLGTAKKNVIMEQSTYMNQLASIVALTVQVAKSAALSSICYSCVVVICNILELSTPDFLMELQKTVNLSSFLTCLLARKNSHILFQTLKISRTLLEKHQQFFFVTFTKEGVKHSIDAIVSQEKNSSHQSKRKNSMKESCLCSDLESSSTHEPCRIGNNAVMKLAEEIKKSFFSVKGSKKSPPRFGFALKSFRDFFARLNVHASTPPAENPDNCKQLSDLSKRLLSDELPVTSTFEFVQSGSVKHLAVYLSNGAYCNADISDGQDVLGQLNEVQSRLQTFASLALTMSNERSVNPLGILVEKLQDTLHVCYDSFPVMLSDEQYTRESMMIPVRYLEPQERTSLELKFRRSKREKELRNYNDVLSVDLFSTPDAIEPVLFPENLNQEVETNGSRKLGESINDDGNKSSKLRFLYNGVILQPSATFFESILRLTNKEQSDVLIDPSFWDEEHNITYRNRNKGTEISSQSSYNTQLSHVQENLQHAWLKDPFFTAILLGKLPGDLDRSDPSYNLMFMLKVLEGLNRFSYQLLMDEQITKFAEGTLQDINDLNVAIYPVPQHQFMSSLLTNKLELQMQDSLFEDGLIPSWCVYLVETCPFLLSFDTRWKYFCLTAHRSFMTGQVNSSLDQVSNTSDQVNHHSDQVKSPPQTKKYRVTRSAILEGAVSMMTKHGPSSRIIEVEFEGEVGTGRGPTFEFYTTVSHELQRAGLGMWRGDNIEDGSIHASFGLFPKPWSSSGTSLRGIDFSNVLQKFKLLGHLFVRAVLDGRILDIPLSKAFYKIMLEQELDIYDIPLFDPELGKTLIEFQALVNRKKFLETSSRTSNSTAVLSYKNVKLEDLCLDFTLPGSPEYELIPGGSQKMVTLDSLEEYVSLVVDATLKSGIAKQIEAFKSGINEVFALKTLKMFTEEEMERILCGEQDAWALKNLEDHMEFEHGYDMSSPSIITFLEILREFGREEQRAFIQFTTGAPQLPLGGLASLDPKLTVVRKQCDGNVDDELPSVNTCRHFIKLPPYSSKEIMRKKLKYAITEGLGSFHLS